ncbi:MAG: universal stress protein [Desulfobacteraceae bacterium]|nr:universal stress protein [Desulfobacteraceae bacterium]
MDYKKILLPYNFTKNDKKGLDFIISNYAGAENVSVTVFHLHPPIPELVLNRDSVMDRMSNSMRYLKTRSIEQENKVMEVKQLLLNSGFKDSQVSSLYLRKTRDIAQEIKRLVQNEGYNTIVLNYTGGIKGFFNASVSNKVITSTRDICVIVLT